MQQFYTTFKAMGSDVEVWLETSANGIALLEALPGRFEALEDRLSRFRPHSELMQFNARSGDTVPVSETLLANISAAKHAARLTDGLYNPLVLPAMLAAGYDRSYESITGTRAPHAVPVADWRAITIDTANSTVRIPVGGAVDLGGVAKGWTAATIAKELSAYGACLVSVGGDMVAHGRPQNGHGWCVAVAEPGSDAQNALSVSIRDVAVVTSGIDRRRWLADDHAQHHIIDPRTGVPARTDVRTITIIHPHAPTAEAYAKAVLLLGSEAGLNWLNDQWQAAGMVVRNDHAILATHNFQTYIDEGASYVS